MSNTVIIPTAGLGTRMGNYTKNLNKALLPYKDKPILAQIIDSFPHDSKFIIALGYLKQQIIDFCKVAYADRNIEFVEVDWTSERAGTGYTLLQCKDLVSEPFWYVPCDTYFDESVVDRVQDKDCYFVKSVAERDSHLYTMFKTDSLGKILEITFKQSQNTDWQAFTGLMYIHQWQEFFTELSSINSNEFIDIINTGSNTKPLETWLDFGSAEQYQTELSKSQKFDFTKKDELTYICNGRVVKWWLDATVAKKKYLKAQTNPKVYPANCVYSNNYLAYDFFPGTTLYQANNVELFDDLLNWLDTKVWIINNENIDAACREFYKTKSLSRIYAFLEKYPNLETITNIDGVEVQHYSYYLDRIDWQYLAQTNLSGTLHGDLQFDNIVISDRREFKVIDWRHEFAGIVEYGDIYYDLAKLAGGFVINYANIKNHNFNIEIDGSQVTLSVPNVDNIDVYQRKLKDYVVSKNLDYRKVQTLIPVIFWNMAPLHTAPFDVFLWYLGIKLFQELENETTAGN